MALFNAQLIAGVVIGLVIWSLMSDRPLLRDIVVAVAAASILDVLSGKRSPDDVGWAIERMSIAISVHPHFTVGAILAATAATLVSRFTQQLDTDE